MISLVMKSILCLIALFAIGLGVPAAAGDGMKLRFLGQATFPTGYTFKGTEVGGLSGIDFDRGRNIYYVISDDRSEKNPARFYTLTIDLSDGRLDDGDIAFKTVVTLRDRRGEPFRKHHVDPEAIRHDAKRDTLYWSSEGNAQILIPPFVREMALDGGFVREFKTPADYIPTADSSSGIRNNYAFESLTRWSEDTLLTATENALYQDGPPASPTVGSRARVLQLRIGDGRGTKQYVYLTDPIPDPPNPPGRFATNGLVEILALDEETILAVERAFSVGAGNTIRLYRAALGSAAPDISKAQPMTKSLVLDLKVLGIKLDNIEGITFGPRLATGERTLILVSDNNFNPRGQFTQFLVFAIEGVDQD